MAKKDLSSYLREREINLPEPSKDILDDGEALQLAAEAWGTHEKGIRAVIGMRIAHIRKELLLNAAPEEVIVLRQALAEVAGLIDDFQTCAAEVKRRAESEDEADDEPESEDVEEPEPDNTSM